MNSYTHPFNPLTHSLLNQKSLLCHALYKNKLVAKYDFHSDCERRAPALLSLLTVIGRLNNRLRRVTHTLEVCRKLKVGLVSVIKNRSKPCISKNHSTHPRCTHLSQWMCERTTSKHLLTLTAKVQQKRHRILVTINAAWNHGWLLQTISIIQHNTQSPTRTMATAIQCKTAV